MHHKARGMLVAQRTQLINALRGHLAEIGVIAAQGLKNARELAGIITAEGIETIPACVRAALAPLVRQLHVRDQEIACSDRAIAAMARGNEMAPIFAEIARRGRACGPLHRRPHDDALRSWAKKLMQTKPSSLSPSRSPIKCRASPSRSCAARQPIAQLRRNDRRHRLRPRAAKESRVTKR
jgi:transposase